MAAWQQIVTVFYPHIYTSHFISNDDYLANLRESLMGCFVMDSKRSDLLFIGDSHGYAGWDYHEVAKQRGDPDISACTMGGFNVMTLKLLTHKLEILNYFPKTIVFGTSSRMFKTLPRAKKQVQQHDQLLKQWWRIYPSSLARLLLIAPIFRTHATSFDKMNIHAPLIESLKEPILIENLNRSGLMMTMKTSKYVSETNFNGKSSSEIDGFCGFVRQHEIRLMVVHLPLNPLYWQLFSTKVKDHYQEQLNRLAQCSDKVIFKDAKAYGLGNRHYINRNFDHNPSLYKVWEKVQKKGTQNGIDLKHLNPLGATIFTSQAVSELVL